MPGFFLYAKCNIFYFTRLEQFRMEAKNDAGDDLAQQLKIFERLPYYCVILTPDAQVLSASEAYLTLIGRPAESLIGHNIFEVFKGNENWNRAIAGGMIESMRLAWESRRKQDLPVMRIDLPKWDRPGQSVESYWQISHTPVFDDAGEALYLIHDIKDLSAEMIAANELKASLEQEGDARAKANLLSSQMQKLFDEMPAQVAILLGPDLIYNYVNPTYQKQIFGKDDKLGLPLHVALPEIRESEILPHVEMANQEGISYTKNEMEILLRNEQTGVLEKRYFNLMYQPIRDEHNQVSGIISLTFEVTDLVLARKALEVREMELAELNEELNATIEELNVSNEELKASNDMLKEAHEDLRKFNIELEDRVLERTNALQELQRAAEGQAQRLRFLLNAIPQQVWTTDPQGNLMAVNEMLCKDLGHSSEEVLQIGLAQFAHPDDLPLIFERWMEALRSGKEYTAEYRLRFADGSYKWHLGRALPMIENGAVTFWLGTNTNIDVQKENEQRKDEFLSIASHELKTPLTSIKSFNQLMNRVSEGQQLGLYIQKSYNNIIRLEKLINDLLDVTKINAGKMVYDMQPFDFMQMVRETIENIQLTVNSHEIVLNSSEAFSFTGDRLRLEQVLINLLDNAIKYSPGGEEVLVLVSRENDYVIVCIQDYGVGIDRSNVNRLFDRYYRTDNTAMRFEGLGLGLFISADIVKRHHGTYWLESEPGKGSSFYFRLPLHPEQQPEASVDEQRQYEDEYVQIRYNAEADQLEARWFGYQALETVERGGLKILELLKENRAGKLLNDNTDVLGNWSEASEWVALDLLPKMEAAGLKYIGWVQSRSAFSRLSAQKTADLAKVDIEMSFFSERMAAEAWLQTKSLSA